MRVLIAYDGSGPAELAVEEVLRRPWPAGTEVRIVTVVERPVSAEAPNGVDLCAPVVDQMEASLREGAYRRIQVLLRRFASRPELRVSYDLRNGSPTQGLLQAIREWQAALVVTGSRGAGPLGRVLLGSVSHALVTHAPCNVEVVKGPPGPQHAV